MRGFLHESRDFGEPWLGYRCGTDLASGTLYGRRVRERSDIALESAY